MLSKLLDNPWSLVLRLRLLEKFNGQTCYLVILAGVLLLLTVRYGVGIAPVSKNKWGPYRLWTSNATNYTYNLLRSYVFFETSVEQKTCTLKQRIIKGALCYRKLQEVRCLTTLQFHLFGVHVVKVHTVIILFTTSVSNIFSA